MRTSQYLFCLSAVLALSTPTTAREPAQTQPQANEAVMAIARGVFDMRANPRPYAVFMVLEQEGNRYPSFWCGRNLSGNLTFNGQMDLISERISLNQSGELVLQITNAAHKHGMHDALPGGGWIAGLREHNFRITIDAFLNPVYKGVKQTPVATGQGSSAAPSVVLFDVTLRGQVGVAGKTAPFTGTATIGFRDDTQAFTLSAAFPFPGTALGIEGAKGTGITAKIFTSSATSKVLPTGRDSANDAVDTLVP